MILNLWRTLLLTFSSSLPLHPNVIVSTLSCEKTTNNRRRFKIDNRRQQIIIKTTLAGLEQEARELPPPVRSAVATTPTVNGAKSRKWKMDISLVSRGGNLCTVTAITSRQESRGHTTRRKTRRKTRQSGTDTHSQYFQSECH